MQRIVNEVSFDSVNDSRDNGALPHKPAFVHYLPKVHLKQTTNDEFTVTEIKIYLTVNNSETKHAQQFPIGMSIKLLQESDQVMNQFEIETIAYRFEIFSMYLEIY